MEQLSRNTIATLSMDEYQAVNCGRPSTPMTLAPVVYCLGQRFLRFDARVSGEQASTLGWRKRVGLGGQTIGMKAFGSSAPLKDLQEKVGFTPQAATKEKTTMLSNPKRSE